MQLNVLPIDTIHRDIVGEDTIEDLAFRAQLIVVRLIGRVLAGEVEDLAERPVGTTGPVAGGNSCIEHQLRRELESRREQISYWMGRGVSLFAHLRQRCSEQRGRQ